MIKLDEMEDGYLYAISARNSNLGIWKEKEKGFVISRFKFYDNYTFIEYHYDANSTFGTAIPYKKLEKAPDEVINGKGVLDYLNKAADIYSYRKD